MSMLVLVPLMAPELAEAKSASPGALATADDRRILGKRYRDLKWLGYKDLGGRLIDTERNISVAVHSKAGRTILVLEHLTNEPDGSARSRAMDVLTLPAMNAKTETLAHFCTSRGEEDPELIAIAHYSDTENWRVKKVWRANRRTKMFEVVPTAGIAGVNIGYGAD